MPKNFRHRLKNIIKESLGDMEWIKNSKSSFKPKFDFNEKEYWVDVSKIEREGREKIVDYIKKTIPNFEEFGGGDSDRTDYEPEENLICYSNSSYEDDYEKDNPYADILKSIYVDGQDILDYLSIIGDEEELEESLEWTDKDVPFDEKDKSFESDPSWKNDEDWALNPERSYWKQGDAGGSGGGDMNESDELQWIKDVKPRLPLKIGTCLTFKQYEEEEDWVEDEYGNMVDHGKMDWHIIDEYNDKKPTFKMVATDRMGEGRELWVEVEKVKELYDRGVYQPCKKQTYLKRIMKEESDDFEWIKNVKPDPLIASPDVFFRDDDDMFYTLDQLGHDTTNMTEMTMAELAINYGYRWSEEHEGWYHRDEVADFVKGNYPKGVRRGIDESDELQWIKNVPDTVPPIEKRNKISLKDFIIDIAKDDLYLSHFLANESFIKPTDEYMRTGNDGEGFTPEDWDEFGHDEWIENNKWFDNYEWENDPELWHEIRESVEATNGFWELVEWDTKEYDLEYGTHHDRMVFKRKSDGTYFALDFSGSSHDGIEDWGDELYQVFPKEITKFIYESNKKIMFEGDISWIEDVEPHKN
jgi:hypothetical protein